MDGPFTLVQSSTSQSALPVLRRLVADETNPILLFCLLYPPTSLFGRHTSQERVKVFDWTDRVPGYTQECTLALDLLAAVKEASGPTTIVIDSLDTLSSDINSKTEAYKLLCQVRSLPSVRLIIHAINPPVGSSLDLLPIITQTSFSSNLTHIIAHPTALILYISSNYLCPPPPLSPAPKFWSIFIPISERYHEADKLVFGAGGSGNSVNDDELIVELLVRGGSTDGGRKKRSVERTLHGWNSIRGLCELKYLESLSSLWSASKPSTEKDVPPIDPTNNLSFNLNLTESQQVARAQVPLPYVHQGEEHKVDSSQGAIFYDPDSADDIDDDDPDEDLDI